MALDLEVIARKAEGGSEYPPLLFVHGSCHAAWCWDEHFLPYFADHGFDSYALSLRGHGGSAARAASAGPPSPPTWPMSSRWPPSCPASPSSSGTRSADSSSRNTREARPTRRRACRALAPAGHAQRVAALVAARSVAVLQDVAHPGPLRPLRYARALSPIRVLSRHGPGDRAPVLGPPGARVRPLRGGTLGKPPDAERIRGTPMLILGAAEDRIVPEPPLRDTAADYGADLTMIPDMAHDMMLEDTGSRPPAPCWTGSAAPSAPA